MTMSDLNDLFLPVGQFCRREVITCAPDERLVDAALVMREQNISSLVVCQQGTPVGIVTDRNLRNKNGREPDNRITLERLNRMEQGRLRCALEGVRSFQELLQRRYQLGQLL